MPTKTLLFLKCRNQSALMLLSFNWDRVKIDWQRKMTAARRLMHFLQFARASPFPTASHWAIFNKTLCMITQRRRNRCNPLRTHHACILTIIAHALDLSRRDSIGRLFIKSLGCARCTHLGGVLSSSSCRAFASG
jgi:hypothetical protein